MKKRKFKFTADHAKLLGSVWIGWNDCEFGAPEIDPKRPYGNGWVIGDIHELLSGKELKECEWTNELEDKYIRIHSETATALQIILTNLGETSYIGEWETEQYSNKWSKVPDATVLG